MNKPSVWYWVPEFTSHPMAPQFQEATLVKLNDAHPITQA